MRNTLICTVGTSLLNNLKRADEDLKKILEKEQNSLTPIDLKKITSFLLNQQNTDRVCGAEINSVTRICNQGFLTYFDCLFFLVSDTDGGHKMGDILAHYYKHNQNPVKFKNIESKTLEGLRDDSVHDFKTKGLKNLVLEISNAVNQRSSEEIAINATGGYKAQISFAGMIGQALEIPVYYLFETFPEVIELPPQPVALDLAFWLENYILFKTIETEGTIEKSSLKLINIFDNQYLQALIEEDDSSYITLSAMGELFHQRARLQFAKQSTAILSQIPQDDTEPDQKQIKLSGTHHGNDILKKLSKKICASPYVKSIVNSIDHNSKITNPIRHPNSNGQFNFVLTWTDRGLGICVQTTGRNLAETNSIAIHLAEKYSK